MCDINTQSGSFEFTHKGQLSACQSLSQSLPLFWCLLTTAEDVCWNVDMANPKLCHLSLPLFQCSFSFHVLMSNALVFIHAGFVCVTNFVSPVSCFGSLPAFMLAFYVSAIFFLLNAWPIILLSSPNHVLTPLFFFPVISFSNLFSHDVTFLSPIFLYHTLLFLSLSGFTARGNSLWSWTIQSVQSTNRSFESGR